jgi:hypothetical protein
MHWIQLRVLAAYYPACDASRFHSQVLRFDPNGGDDATDIRYTHNAEFLWEEGQDQSIQIATLKAMRQFVMASGLDCPR